MRGYGAVAIIAVVLMLPISRSFASDAPWQIGLASVCITPEQPVWLYGYANQNRFQPFDGRLDDLFARAMAIQCPGGELAVLIAADLCVLREPEERELSLVLTQRTGLERRQILLNWSHTHSGPMIGTSDLNRYPIPEEDLQKTKAYTQWLWNRLADVAQAALEDRQPAWLAWGVGRADFIRNRRMLDADGKYHRMAPYPDGPIDARIPVLRIDGPDGQLRGVVFGAACHPVTLGGSNRKVSADFPGYARQAIEQQYPGSTTLFVQGCGADANPEPRATADQQAWVQRHGASLGAEVCRVLAGSMPPSKRSRCGSPVTATKSTVTATKSTVTCRRRESSSKEGMKRWVWFPLTSVGSPLRLSKS